MSVLSFTQAITKATAELMDHDDRVHVLGLGATYPNGLDGTMADLAKVHPGRVHDTPCSEAAITGAAVGMAAMGLRPIVHHGRIEFALYAMDALLTQAAKWNYMFGGDYPVPLTVRIAMGRQWGNGPQHTMNRKTLFSHPGLRVVCPSTPQAAYELMHSSVVDPNPVIYLEPRWLYKLKGEVIELESIPRKPGARVLRKGTDMTIVGVGDTVLEALRAAQYLDGLASLEVIDLVSIYPVDTGTLHKSVSKTGRVLVVESDTLSGSLAAEVLAKLSADQQYYLGCNEHPCPTATSQTAAYYPLDKDIVDIVATVLGLTIQAMPAKTFDQLNLPPTDNVSELITEKYV